MRERRATMIQSYTPSLIMFIATVSVTALFIIPILRVHIKHDLTRFYWRGFWIFLALIAAFAGGQQILMLAGVEVEKASVFYLVGLTAAYITFVVFAWFRLTLVTIWGFGFEFLRRIRGGKKT